MKRAIACPYCGAGGEPGGAVEPWGESLGQSVLHCGACDGIFSVRARRFGDPTVSPLGPDAQAYLRAEHEGARDPGYLAPTARLADSDVECPVCGELFATRWALEDHTSIRHRGGSG